jgi:hypothetical protein
MIASLLESEVKKKFRFLICVGGTRQVEKFPKLVQSKFVSITSKKYGLFEKNLKYKKTHAREIEHSTIIL